MIEVKEILAHTPYPPLEVVSQALDSEAASHAIDKVNWAAYPYKPTVEVRMGYNAHELFLKYTVTEDAVKAAYVENNSKVFTDSCCELFISPDSNDSYYNFEISCIGTLLVGFRRLSQPATRTSDELMAKVRRHSTLGTEPFGVRVGTCTYALTVAIPLEVFFAHELESLKGKTVTANLYKCGDELPTPHYLSLFPIGTEKPAFHRPDFFGQLKFV